MIRNRLAGLAALLLAFSGPAAAGRFGPPPGGGAPAPPLGATAFRGGAPSAGPRIVHFWATWCVPCRRELPVLGEAVPRLAAAGVGVVTVALRDHPDDLAAYLDELGVALPVLLDADGRDAASWRVLGLPSTFVVDGAGRVRGVHIGPLPWEDPAVGAEIAALAGAAPAQAP
ncbi:TlpA family protein disulfide reductase [Inmirania thermothiophila]|uniref:Cytochrome c biogenesis protein CcmG/thiol:disulfide interchange protein DsbE n=1 Tax=Inmirania thermothiophila TaxID=1750597 RepID=A0A3N1Y650_9GAMM|nr:TlpA disulfide reductase family protein [Inmirania thermothiophila]ROR34230.1 cytochrome c biogenesis protein CcmG/thiol:disulfide interchange protein DsbE [Inmirania thermothiophila]